jgi:hypothetical protein
VYLCRCPRVCVVWCGRRAAAGGLQLSHPSPFANNAIPDDGAAPTASEVSALIGTFRSPDRVPRLEYLPSCAPQVEPVLLSAGFTAENRAAVMACSAETLITPRAATEVLITEPTDDAGLQRRRRHRGRRGRLLIAGGRLE